MFYSDFISNTVHHFDIPGQHEQIQVSAHALVEVMASPAPRPQDVQDWETLDASVARGDFWEMLLPSQYTQATALLEELASELRVERRGNPLELLLELNEALYRTFAYVPNSTKVDSPIDDALRARQGVCQDFAHVMTALVRRLKIPCRYVSGYLFHEAKSKDRSSPGATHAWVEAFLGDVGWVGFDPTNQLVGGERHIRVALGRDYRCCTDSRRIQRGCGKHSFRGGDGCSGEFAGPGGVATGDCSSLQAAKLGTREFLPGPTAAITNSASRRVPGMGRSAYSRPVTPVASCRPAVELTKM